MVTGVLLAALLTGGTGCLSGAQLRRGEMAEARGAYHEAYTIYCDAARDTPRSGQVRRALARVAPLAAQYWKNRGHGFERRQQYDLAWKCYMQALDIRPHDAAALADVRRIERASSEQIAGARESWVRYGSRALVLSQAELSAADTAVAESPEKNFDRETEQPGRPSATPDETRSAEAPYETPLPEPRDRAVARAETGLKEVPPRAKPAPPITSKTERESKASATARSADASRSSAESFAAGSEPLPDTSGGAENDFLVTRTASRDDARYRKTVHLGDDIRVRVLDTDPDPDADVAVYLGRRQILKVENWPIGGRVRVIGQSGRHYAIVILDIHDKTETVKFGFRRVPIDGPAQ